MKRKFCFYYLLFILFFLVPGVYAQTAEVKQILSKMSEIIAIPLGDVQGSGSTSAGEIIFIKLLIFILLFVIIRMVLKRVPNFDDSEAIPGIIAFIVSLIAIRFITTANVIEFIWLPYGTLGIVLSVVLPFIIGFYFINGFDSSAIRRIGWATFAVIFFGLTFMRMDELSTGPEWYQNLAWMYFAIAFLSLMLFLFDGSIRRMMYMSSVRNMDDVNKRVEAARLSVEIDKNRQVLAMTTDSKGRKALERKIREQKKTMKALLRG